MATIAATGPLQREPYLPDALAKSLATYQNLNSPTLASTDSGTPAAHFAFNQETFGKLQIYLLQVQKFPESWARFETLYPERIFKKRLDDVEIGLYQDMKETLVAIRAHCVEFKNVDLTALNTLSGEVANFAEVNAKQIKIIEDKMPIITDETKKLTDKDVKSAIEDVWGACQKIAAPARRLADRCKTLKQRFEAFKTTTETDGKNLQHLNTQSDKAWLSRERLSEDLQQSAKKGYDSLGPMFDEQLGYAKKHDGMNSWTNSIGAVLYYDTEEQLKKLKDLDGRFDDAWKTRKDEYHTTMEFKASSKLLEQNINDVQKSVQGAIESIDVMTKALSAFESDINIISDALEDTERYLTSNKVERRAQAFEQYAECRRQWENVAKAARWYQQNGLELSKKLNEMGLGARPVPAPRLEIDGANFGSLNITPYATALWHMDIYLGIRCTARTFSDPWPTIEKSMSCLYRYGNERRILLCQEYTNTGDTYRIEEGPLNKSSTGSALHQVISPPTAPASSKIQIVAVTWGLVLITDFVVWDKLYNQAGTTVTFGNELFGTDGWRGSLKSGTIYYYVKSDPGRMLQFSLKEGKSDFWRV